MIDFSLRVVLSIMILIYLVFIIRLGFSDVEIKEVDRESEDYISE